jgi:DNA-binding SARP family transcriptional activator
VRPGTLFISLFSSFSVSLDGMDITDRLPGKARQLLKILAAHNKRPLPKDVLIDLLWPRADPVTGAGSLKVAAHNLRSSLEPDKAIGEPGAWIVARNGTYGLDREARVEIDTERFITCWRDARECERQGRFGAALELYREAERMYVGDYLENEVYDDWTIIHREELRDLFLDVLGRLAQLACDDGAHQDVIRYCHKIVLADPCREDAYRMLMNSHAALNQLARAGAWYAVCRTKLLREVEAQPSPETVQAFEQLFSRVS